MVGGKGNGREKRREMGAVGAVGAVASIVKMGEAKPVKEV